MNAKLERTSEEIQAELDLVRKKIARINKQYADERTDWKERKRLGAEERELEDKERELQKELNKAYTREDKEKAETKASEEAAMTAEEIEAKIADLEDNAKRVSKSGVDADEYHHGPNRFDNTLSPEERKWRAERNEEYTDQAQRYLDKANELRELLAGRGKEKKPTSTPTPTPDVNDVSDGLGI